MWIWQASAFSSERVRCVDATRRVAQLNGGVFTRVPLALPVTEAGYPAGVPPAGMAGLALCAPLSHHDRDRVHLPTVRPLKHAQTGTAGARRTR